MRGESPWRAPPVKSPTVGKDLGGTRLLRRGRSLQASPGETFPGVGPHQCIRYCKTRYARGPAPGNFFWGRMDFLKFEDGRDWLTGCHGNLFEAEYPMAMRNEE